jgi:hypothetical protein
VGISKFIYVTVQNDVGDGTVIKDSDTLSRQVADAIAFPGATSETAVWHFMATANTGAIHHFAVVPSYDQSSTQGRQYTIFMAYENSYTLGCK